VAVITAAWALKTGGQIEVPARFRGLAPHLLDGYQNRLSFARVQGCQ
jgi:hypothetical protein